jgi:crotonobetainyl-CoA:carnitine CoA-transferase CaiB-like acyl-CoA transferase
MSQVVRPLAGDEAQAWDPLFTGDASGWFVSTNRNKRSVMIDVKIAEEREVLHSLIGQTHVIESLNSAKLEKLGLGPPELTQRHPRPIFCAMLGYDFDAPAMHFRVTILRPSRGPA